MLYSLSPEQSTAEKSIAETDLSDIKFFDASTAMSSVLSAIYRRLLDGQKILIHIPSDCPFASDYLDQITNVGLDQLTIQADQSAPISETDVIKLRSIVKREVDIQTILSEVQYRAEIAKSKESILSYYTLMDQKVLSGISLRSYAYQEIYSEKKTESADLISILTNNTFTTEEYHGLRRVVDLASQMYDIKYDLYDTVGILSPAIWQKTDTSPSDSLADLTVIKDQLTALNQRFASAATEFQQEKLSAIKRIAHTITIKFSDCQLQCASLKIAAEYSETTPTRFSLFGKKESNPQAAVISEMWDDLVKATVQISQVWHQQSSNLPPPTDMDQLLEMLETLTQQLADHVHAQSQDVSKHLHRVNRVNTTSHTIKELDQQLNAIVAEIDALSIFTHNGGKNTLSFIKQKEKCTELLTHVTSAWHLLNDETGYVQWKQFVGSLDSQKIDLLQNLRQFSTQQWVEIFDNSYRDLIIKHASSVPCPSDQLTQITTIYERWTSSAVPALINRLQKNRKQASDSLMVSNKELYATLFKKKNLPATGWNDIALMNLEFMQSFFPIHIVSNLKNISKYDCVISLVERAPENEDRIHHISPILQTDLESSSKNILFLYLNSYDYTEPLTQLSSSTKLKAAKKLSKYILSLNQDAKIYQTKNANIISLLPFLDDNRLEANLQPLGLKTIDTHDSLYDKLSESILFTDRPQYLIIKDQMINPDLHQQMTWQRHVTSLFESAGIQVISVNTSDQLEDNEAVFGEMMARLVQEGHHHTTEDVISNMNAQHPV